MVYICCSGEPRVGNTLTARLLLDLVLSGREHPIAFDTNVAEPRLATLFPQLCTAVDINSTAGQMTLFDRLIAADGAPKIIDVWHAQFDRFVRLAAELGVNQEARNVQPVFFLHSCDPAKFRRAYVSLQKAWPSAKIVLVENRGLSPAKFWSPVTFYAIYIERLSDELLSALERTKWLAFRSILRPEASTSTQLEALARAELIPIYDQLQRLHVQLALTGPGFLG